MNLVIIQNNFYNEPVDIITDQAANYKPLFMPFTSTFDDRKTEMNNRKTELKMGARQGQNDNSS